MVFDHLVSLGPLVDISEVARHALNAASVGEDRLFKLFKAAVGQSQVVKDVGLVRQEGLVLEGCLHRGDALFVLFEREVDQALSIEHLRVPAVHLERLVEIVDCELILFHVKEAL